MDTPLFTSTRLPEFPPHAVVKSPSPEVIPSIPSDVSNQPPIESTGEGLIWAPKLRIGESEKAVVGVRGKGDIGKCGWGHLPPEVIRLILNHATTNLYIPPMIKKAWEHNPYCAEVVDALAVRMRMFSLRRVCQSWRHAADGSPFWGRYIRLICPTYDYDKVDAPAIAAHNANSRSSSNAIPFQGPSPFIRACRVHFSICITCVLTMPSRTVAYPAYRKAEPMLLEGLCWVRVCDLHEEQACNSCGRGEHPIPTQGLYDSTSDLCISPSVEEEINELDGYRNPESPICRLCRQAALDNSITRQLRSCARSGGVIRGSEFEWDLFPDYDGYILHGNLTARYTAERLVNKWALTTQGRYSDLKSLARELQQKEILMKWNYLHGYHLESREDKEERILLSHTLSPYVSLEAIRDVNSLRTLMRGWDWDLKVGGNQVFEEIRTECADPDLNDKYAAILQDAVINDFLVERFRIGIWVLPSFEADILSSYPRIQPGTPPTPSPLTPLFSRLTHPFASHPQILQYQNPLIPTGPALGIFHLSEYHLGVGSKLPGEAILPPSLTIQTMDERFIWWLRKTLGPAMKRLVEDIVKTVGGREREAEEICASMGLREVLQALRGEEVWLNTKSAERRIQRIETFEKSKKAEEAIESHMDIGMEEKVEPVTTTTLAQSTSTTLGKRKTPPADLAQKDGDDVPVPNRPARASRESSVHRVSTSTSTSTPEDIVMPITPNDEAAETLRTFIAEMTGEESGKQLTEDIAKMAKSLGITPSTKAGDGVGGMIVEEKEPEDGDGDEELDGSSMASDIEVGRGVNGHYEEQYEEEEEEEEEGEYEDEELEDFMVEEDELLADKRLREENEVMDAAKTKNGNKETGLFTPGSTLSSSISSISSSSPESIGPPGLYPKEKKFHTRIHEIPFIPLPDSDDPSDPTMKLLCGDIIMDLWWDCRKALRVCRCGICERARAINSVERDLNGLLK